MIKAAIVGGYETVERVKRMTPSVRGELRKTVELLSIKLLRNVKQDKLTGQVLNVRTGRLRRSINYRIEQEGDGIYGYVGTNVDYGRAWEQGFEGDVNVREHLRKTVSGESTVRAHIRHVVMPQRSFLRSALADMADDIRTGLKNAAIEGAKQA